MENNFLRISENEVLSIEEEFFCKEPLFYLPQTFRVQELTERIKEVILNPEFEDGFEEREKLLNEGLAAEALFFGSAGWQKGRFRVTVNVEFCPDEPEVEEPAASNQPDTSEPESPLDDIRRMMTEEKS